MAFKTQKPIERDRLASLMQKVVRRLEEGSLFFHRNPARQLPSFELEELSLGQILGSGEFGVVHDVNTIRASEESCKEDIWEQTSIRDGDEITPPPCLNTEQEGFIPIADTSRHDIEPSMMQQCAFMKTHCQREGVSRYALKLLRRDSAECAVHLVTEAKFLLSLSHPNIIKIRATIGNSNLPKSMIIMDRLVLSLEQKIEEWKASDQKCYRILDFCCPRNDTFTELIAERALVMYDIARAFKYLHKKNILYRDIKPDNIGFDFRNDVKLFDFGLARELKPKDLVEPPGGYNLTGLTGSRRYMAPEVVRCKPYGLASDVYSFGVLLWQVFSLEIPYANFGIDKHFELVVLKGERPRPLYFLPTMLQYLMEACWAKNPKKRPRFGQICERLRTEIAILDDMGASYLSDRTTWLVDGSISSKRKQV